MYSYVADVEKLRQNLGPRLQPGFVFLNIGASDGIVADPIYPFMVSHQPRGIAVEPVPYVMERLKANYRDFPGIIFEQVAVSDTPRSFFYVEESSGSIDYVMRCIGSMSRDHLLSTLSGLRALEGQIGRAPPVPPDTPLEARDAVHDGQAIVEDAEAHIREIEVECASVATLMERNGLDHVDFVNIDVEGFDDEVFWSIDWEHFRPAVICIELLGGGLAEDVVARIQTRLDDLGYRPVQSFGVFSLVYVRGD